MRPDTEGLVIRRETEADRGAVEAVTRDAFWDLYVPGCSEHYLAHVLRSHPDFVPELDLVAELDGRVVGSVMYTRARLIDGAGRETPVLTFGPVCVTPELQRRGIGRRLLETSFETARATGCGAIVIFGDPKNYVARGFKSCKRYNVCLEGDVFPAGMLVKELLPGALDGRRRYYAGSDAYDIDEAAAAEFDKAFPPREKRVTPGQEIFYIQSHSVIM